MLRFAPLLALSVLGVLACEKKATPSQEPSATSALTQATSAPAPAPEEKGPIVIGSIGSLTGADASFGVSIRDAIQLAIEEVNAAGGVKGRRVELLAYDTQGKLEESVSAVQRMVSKDRVAVILGDVSSTASLAIADVAQAARIPMVTPAATHPDVTRKGDYIFRVCFIDAFQGQVMARFAREHLKLERISILQDIKSAYSLGLSGPFNQAFTKLGGTIVSVETYSKGDTDFRSSLLKLKKDKPQALYVPGFYSDVGLIARQAREVGLTIPLLGGDAWDSEVLFELAGDAALEGSYYSTHYSPDHPTPELQRVAPIYRARYGRELDTASVLGYDAARVALAAMQRAESLTGPAIRDAIAKTKDFPGISGNLTLDAERNPVKPAVILKIQGGKREFVTAVTP
jgi:branched-chain amino acid transport system substrate-binding protein